MITAVDCTIIRFDGSIIKPEFFNYYSQSSQYLSDVETYCTGATRKRISRKNLGKIEVPIPSVSEQNRIIAILDEAFEGIDTVIANTEKNLVNVLELIGSYVKKLFSEKSDLWKQRKLGDVGHNLDSRRVPITKSKRKVGDVPYYGASGVVDYVDSYIFDEDLLLVSEDGANLLARSYPIAFSILGKSWVNNHAHVLRFDNGTSQKFVEYYLNSMSLSPYVSGMAQPKLNQKALNSIVVPFPSISEQEEVTKRLDELSPSRQQLTAIYQQKLTALAELKQSLLHKAFSGELTAKGAEAAVEEATA
ncbi:restriction endonuclease subunit S [Halomonas daqiaonensis]|nr:restriction endonuclease subunit S [Halomonas daqiaonensis]